MKLLKQVNIGKFGVRLANYSGITAISGNRYAVVDDKELIDGFMFLGSPRARGFSLGTVTASI